MSKKLESLIAVRKAIIHKEPSRIVQDKYLEYLNEYDNMNNKGIREKIEHRELFRAYMRYMNTARY